MGAPAPPRGPAPGLSTFIWFKSIDEAAVAAHCAWHGCTYRPPPDSTSAGKAELKDPALAAYTKAAMQRLNSMAVAIDRKIYRAAKAAAAQRAAAPEEAPAPPPPAPAAALVHAFGAASSSPCGASAAPPPLVVAASPPAAPSPPPSAPPPVQLASFYGVLDEQQRRLQAEQREAAWRAQRGGASWHQDMAWEMGLDQPSPVAVHRPSRRRRDSPSSVASSSAATVSPAVRFSPAALPSLSPRASSDSTTRILFAQ